MELSLSFSHLRGPCANRSTVCSGSGSMSWPVSHPAPFLYPSSSTGSICLTASFISPELRERKSEKVEREREGGKKEVRGTAGRIWGPPTVWWADASLQQSRRDRCLPSRTIALFLPSRLYAGASSMLQPDGCNFGRCVSAVNRARCSRHQQRWLLCHWEKLISARVIDWFLQLSWYIFIVLLISSNFLHVDINYIINIVKFIRKSEVNSLWNILNIKLTRGIWHLFLHAIHYTVCVCVAGVGYRIARLERAS